MSGEEKIAVVSPAILSKHSHRLPENSRQFLEGFVGKWKVVELFVGLDDLRQIDFFGLIVGFVLVLLLEESDCLEEIKRERPLDLYPLHLLLYD